VALLLLGEAALMVQNSGTSIAAARAQPAAAAAAKKPTGPAEAADEASAMLMARLQNRKIEVLSARAADSTTWALPSGSLRTESFTSPVRVKQDGTWQDIDTSLSDMGTDLKPKAAAADIAVSDGGDTQLASVTRGRTRFGMGWESKLPAPKVKGPTASYDLGSGQTLKVTAQKQGFSESVVLAGAPNGPVSYRIPLRLDGLKLSQASSGHLLLKDSTGKLVAEAPAPMMWDSSKNAASGESEHVARVDTKIETAKDGAQTLVLTPDQDFLADPELTYPVTVDPTSTLAVTTDTWLQTPDYPDSQVSSEELKSGTYDAGADLARSYLKFNVAPFAGKHIQSSVMSLYNYYSATCSTSGAPTVARRITTSWSSTTVTWATRPSSSGTDAATNTGHWGYSSACPAAWSNWNLQGITQSWADGTANYGVMVYGEDETDSTTWRRFRSANYTTSGYAPKLVVTYNSYPAVPASAAVSPSTVNAYNAKRYVTSLTPTLSAKVTDADGSTVKAQFEVTPDPAYADTTYTYTATSASVASGYSASLAIPSASAFPAGTHLRMRVRGYDGTDYGSWTGYTTFVLNTGLPAAPGISCPAYPQDTWSAKATGAVTCTLTTASTDGQGFKWGLDDPAMAQRVFDTTDGTGGDPLTVSVTPADGWHTLYAQTVDSGGNLSTATTKYAFGVGADGAAVLSPGEGDRPARRLALAATGKPTYTGVTYQYRRGETDSWHTVPLADVTRNADGSAVTAWPLAATGGAPPALTWNITTSLAEDGPVDIRAAFTDGTTSGYSPPVTVTVDREAGDAPSRDVGPGEVNLLTGDYTVTENDATASGIVVTRSISSRRATADQETEGQATIFGPYWTSGITAETSGTDWLSIRKTSATSVEALDSEGTGTGFTATTAGGWEPEPGAEDLTLTGSLTGSFTLKESSGATTTFAKVDTAATTWQAATSYASGANSTTTVVSEKVVSGSQTLARPKYVLAPTSAVTADACVAAPATKGCRVMEFLYATATTATGYSTAADFGDFTGQVKEIRLWSTEPGATTASAKPLAAYRYDLSGRLRQEWDPNLSQATQTQYSYDSAGRITWLQQHSELGWDFAYGKAGNAATAGEGMLLAASRPGLKQGTADVTEGTAATSLVYDVPLTGSTAPNAMGTSDVAAWGQADVPTDATAVLPADAVPASHDGHALTASAYTRADISYADASGREVNTASPGGHITATEYNTRGDTLRELTAGNRELALATSGDGLAELTRLGLSGSSTAARAQALSTASVYSADGQLLVETYGPTHLVTLAGTLDGGTGGTSVPAGSQIPAREHTVTGYDAGRPTDGTAKFTGLATSVTISAHVDGYPADADAVTNKTVYDWTKGLPTSTIEDAGGKNLTKTTAYDTQGRVIRTTLPKSSGSDSGTTVTTYWSATGTGACNGRPEWADMLCSTGPAADITGGGSNPTQLATKTVEYDWWGQAAKVSETVGSVTRTTTLTNDNAGRTATIAVTGGVGTAVPTATYTYDSETGALAAKQAAGQTITYGYDDLGRAISYNDGAGNTTTTTYDLLDRPVTVTDSSPSTTTFAYNTAQEPRGLPTSKTDSVAGTFGATYDSDGQVSTELLPGGYTLSLGSDQTGAETSATYTRDSDGTVVVADAVDYSVQGRILSHTGTAGDTTEQEYTYDKPGRLTRVDDTAADGSCARRTYTFDDNTNRTALATSISDPGTACTDTGSTTASQTYSYDSADRLTGTGVAYDAFGRTTTQASGTSSDYFVNDLAHSQTSGTQRQTWGLDAEGRLATETTQTQNTDGTWSQTGSKTSHYPSEGDSPSWIKDGTTGGIARTVAGPSGNLAAVTSTTGDVVLQLTNIHGDVTAQLPLDTSKSTVVLRQDEYGNTETGSTTARYAWLGGAQRSSETVTGAIVMGSRLYDPALGRFLSADPVPGGNANAYEYSTADPVNKEDTSGQYHKWKTYHYSWGSALIHTWSFWKNCWCSSWGWHFGATAWIKVNRTWTRRIAVYSGYGYWSIATPLGFAGPWGAALAVLIVWIGTWVQVMAVSAYNRGKCLGIYATVRQVGHAGWRHTAYPYRRSC
jgi:RHS repeat-associated protein